MFFLKVKIYLNSINNLNNIHSINKKILLKAAFLIYY